jgi:hypothetical protein
MRTFRARAAAAAPPPLAIEALEPRVHLSYAPYKIGDALPPPRRYAVDVADRVSLRTQLAGSSIGNTLAALNTASPTFAGDFDRALLDYMKARQSPRYDFGRADVADIVSFVKNSTDADQQKLYKTEVLGTLPAPLGVAPVKPVADKATTNESLVRKGVRYYVYNFQVGGALYPSFTPVEKLAGAGLYVDWLSPRVFGTVDSVTISAHLQRLLHLAPTATAYRFLGAAGHAQTVANTLATWAGQAPALSDAAVLGLYKPAGASGYTTTVPASVRTLPSWTPLDTGVRVYQLLNTYHLMLGTPAWTGELNTLFLSMMFQHGRVLGETARAVYANETSRVLPGDSRAIGINVNPLGRTDNNKALQLCGALLTLSRMFPEFAATRDAGTTIEKSGWVGCAKRLLKDAVARNYRGKYTSFAGAGNTSWRFDGFHKEQSAGYGQNMAETFIEQLKLSQLNGGASGDPLLKNDPELRQLLSGEFVVPKADGAADPAGAIPLATRVEALYQMANPDGTAPSLGDTPRPSLAGTFLKAQLVLPGDGYARNREYTWPTAYPSLADVFGLWNKGVKQVAEQRTYGAGVTYNRYGRGTSLPAGVSAQNRPNSPAKYRSWLPGAGYYMIRSDRGSRDDLQLTFDVGLMGLPNYNPSSNTQAHTQFDLMNFELYGYQRPMIEDPGLVGYGNSRERNWVVTTPAHNSFTVDNYSHARMDGFFGVIGPDENSKGVSVTGYHYGYQTLDVDSNNPNGTGPALARTIWFDRDNTFLVVDWGHQTTTRSHQYRVAFTLPVPPSEPGQAAASKAAAVELVAAGDPSQGVFTSGPRGNLFVQPLKYKRNPSAQQVVLDAATQDAASGVVTGPFVTAPNFTGESAPADRLVVTQTGAGANFVTMLHAYAARKDRNQVLSSATAQIVSQTASTVVVRVTKGGVATDVSFTNPFNAGLAPHRATAALPTRPTTVPARASNPKTGGYPDAIERAEGAAPADLNEGRFTIGPGDSTTTASAGAAARVARRTPAVFGNSIIPQVLDSSAAETDWDDAATSLLS